MDYYELGGKRGHKAAPKLPAEEIAEIVGELDSEIQESLTALELAPVVDIATHPSFDASYLDASPTRRRPEPRAGLRADQAIRA